MVTTLWAMAAAPAGAWTSGGATWTEQPVRYWIAEDLGPFEDPEAVAAIHAAFATWSAVDCTGLRFLYEGRVRAPLFETDGRNVVTVVSDGWPAEWPSPSHTRVVADGAVIVEADVGLDAERVEWTLRGADGVQRLDLRAGLVAAVGRLIGLGDSEVFEATLHPAQLGVPDGRTLSDDDIAGVCTLYPAVLPGDGEIGAPCANDDSCADDLRCVYDATETYCAPTCPAGVCPDGYTCLGFEGQRVCARGGCGCAAGGGPTGVSGFGALLALAAAARRRKSSRPVRMGRIVPTLQ